MMSEWIFATPLTLWLQITDRLAMRISPSHRMAVWRRRSCQPSWVVSNDSCQRRLISSMIWYTRGRSLENVPMGHFSRASGRMVWLV